MSLQNKDNESGRKSKICLLQHLY